MPRGAQPLTPDFLEQEVSLRGVTYRFRELSIGDYDELITKATRKEVNPLSGEETEVVDNTLLMKLMVIKCAVEPRLTAESLAHLPMRVVLTLNKTVNRMHYGDEPEAKPKDGEADEGSDQGND